MKLYCGKQWTWDEFIAHYERWQPCFAWRPVRTIDGGCRWLERVERKGKHHGSFIEIGGFWTWEYRAHSPALKSGEPK